MSVIEMEIQMLKVELDRFGIDYGWVLDDYEGDFECQSHIMWHMMPEGDCDD